jgi:DNA-binding NarL/FixJ family response regulator
MKPLRILIADDHELIRSGLRATVAAKGVGEIVGEAADGREAVALAEKLRPDIVILDMAMPCLNGLEATRQILAVHPTARILILTVYDTEESVRAVLAAGACGYLLKSDASRDLVRAFEALRENKPYFNSKVAHMILDGYIHGGHAQALPAPQANLSAREREILQLIAEGRSTKEVAALLGIAFKTAEVHRTNLMRKLELHSVAELVRYAVRNKIIEA